MRIFARAASLAGLSFALAGCGGGGNTSTPLPPAANVPEAAGLAAPLGFAYSRDLVAKAQLLGRASLVTYAFDVVLKMKDPAGLVTYAQSVGDPKSGNYRRFLGPGEIADRFTATASDRDAAVAYFKAQGLAVGGFRQRMTLRVAGTGAQLEKAFDTQFGLYRSATGTFIAPMGPPRLPKSVPVVGSADIVHGMNLAYTSHYAAKGSGASGGRLFGYSPQQIAAAFDYAGAYGAGFTGAGVTVGIIGTGPVSTNTATRLGDLEAYKALFGVGGASAITVISPAATDPAVNGATGFAPPPPVTPPCDTATKPRPVCNPEDIEAQLDTEQVGSLAKDSAIEFYLAYNPTECSPPVPVTNTACVPPGQSYAALGIQETDQEVQTAIDRNSSDILSLSYGESEVLASSAANNASTLPPFTPGNGNLPPSGLDPLQFAALAAEGIAVFASSGDTGAQGCASPAVPGNQDALCVSYPATDPSVVSVGGVTAPLDGAGRIIGPVTAWGVQAGSGGTGGGTSAYFPQPAFQQGLAGVVGSTRNQPDVSLDGDTSTGVALVANADASLGGQARTPFAIGGTSVAAPQMAAMWALVLQACKMTASCATATGAKPYRLGNPNPLLYAIYRGGKQYAATFLDVTFGNNAQPPYCSNVPLPAGCPSPTPSSGPALDPGFSAGVGYDDVTGLGVPYGRALIRAVVGV